MAAHSSESMNPVANRTLITVDPRDPARWTLKPAVDQEGTRQIMENGGGPLDDYQRIVSPKQVMGKHDQPTEAAIEHHKKMLKDILKGQGSSLKGITDAQLRGAAQALYGVYGENATVTGLHPSLIRAMKAHPRYHEGLHLNGTDEHPYHFMIKDGLYRNDAEGQRDFARQYGKTTPPREDLVSLLNASQLSTFDNTMVEVRKLGVAARDRQRILREEQLKARHLEEQRVRRDGPPTPPTPAVPSVSPPVDESSTPARKGSGKGISDISS